MLTVSAAGLWLIFTGNRSESPAAYPVYVLAFYTLCTVTAFCGTVLPKRYRRLRAALFAHPLGRRCMTDAALKTHISLYVSLSANLFYAGINVLAWALHRSMWFVVLAVYYGILAVMRFLLVRYVRRIGLGQNRLGELRRARLCSSILLLLNIVLTGAGVSILVVAMSLHIIHTCANEIKEIMRDER